MNKHNLIIINQEQPLEFSVLDFLQRKGLSVFSTSNIEDIKDLIEPPNLPILILNCSPFKSSVDFLQQIADDSRLNIFPVLVHIKDTFGIENRLNNFFPLAIAIQRPSDNQKILEAVRFIERNYRSGKPRSLLNEKKVSENNDFESFSRQDVDDTVVRSKEFFSAVKNCQLGKAFLGGNELVDLLSGGLIKKPYKAELPEDSSLKNASSKLLEAIKPSTRQALERINILTMKILKPLNLEPEVLELAKSASILFAHSFAEQNRSFLTRDYSFRGALVFRKEICSAIKDSALNIGSELASRDLSRVIANIGRIVGQEDSGGDNQLAVAASAIVSADLINRLCFQQIFWNASAAYRLIRRIRQGKFRCLHPAISCITLKLLAEAITSPKNKKIRYPKKNKNEADLVHSIKIADETLVELPELEAGMKLSRPLLTEDGKKILSEDLVLDDDLILRIWQLSAVKALEKAVIKRVH